MATHQQHDYMRSNYLVYSYPIRHKGMVYVTNTPFHRISQLIRHPIGYFINIPNLYPFKNIGFKPLDLILYLNPILFAGS